MIIHSNLPSPTNMTTILTSETYKRCGILAITTDIQLLQVYKRSYHGRNLYQLIVWYEQIAQALAVE